MKRVDNVAYDLELLLKLATIHMIFHISILKKWLGDPSLVVPIESIGVKDSLSHEDILVQILDCQVHKLRTKDIASIKVLLWNQLIEKAIREVKDDIKLNTHIYLYLLITMSKAIFFS